MPRINLGVNLNEIEGGIDLLPEGKYAVKILESSKLTQSRSGNPMIVWVTEVIDGEYEGKKLIFTTSLMPNALFTLKALVDAAGINFDEDGFELEECFGLEFGADVKVKKYEGEDRNEVKKFFPLGH